MKLAINNGSLHFTRGFTEAQKAVDKMRNDINGITINYMHINVATVIRTSLNEPHINVYSVCLSVCMFMT